MVVGVDKISIKGASNRPIFKGKLAVSSGSVGVNSEFQGVLPTYNQLVELLLSPTEQF